jgi:serine/threonine-protein kinase RsbW
VTPSQAFLLAAFENAVAALCLAIIGILILAGLRRHGRLRDNPLALATVAVFLATALGRGAHSVIEAARTLGMLSWHPATILHNHPVLQSMTFVADGLTAAAAAWYLSLRRRYGPLLHASLYETRAREAEYLRRSIETLTHSDLPRTFPQADNVRFDAQYLPAEQVTNAGGDWYAAWNLPDGRIAFSLGDVAGHGVDAALWMSRVKQGIQTASCFYTSEPAKVLERANHILALWPDAPMVTALFGIIDPKTFSMTYASAGHLPPVLVEPGGETRFLPHDGLPLGVVDDLRCVREYEIEIPEETLLVAFTDGLIEYRRNLLHGEAKLATVLRRVGMTGSDAPAREIAEGIFAREKPCDDVALLTISFGEKVEEAFTVTLPAVPENASAARAAVASFAQRCGMDEDGEFALVAACGEAIVNACEHAYPKGKLGTFTVSGSLRRGVATVRVEDDGVWPQDAGVSKDPFDERGRGIPMMFALADSVTLYSKLGRHGSVVLMTRAVASAVPFGVEHQPQPLAVLCG